MRDPSNPNRLKPIAFVGYTEPRINLYQKVKSTGKIVPRYIRKKLWSYQCSCGNIVIKEKKQVDRGHTKSCGCLHRELRSKHLKKLHAEGKVKLLQKGHKLSKGWPKGKPAHNKGKIFVRDFPNRRYSTGKFMTLEQLQELWSQHNANHE